MGLGGNHYAKGRDEEKEGCQGDGKLEEGLFKPPARTDKGAALKATYPLAPDLEQDDADKGDGDKYLGDG